MQDMMPSKKSGQQQYGPGLDQIRRHRTIGFKFKTGSMIACLPDLLKFIYLEQGTDHSINRILTIRNQLARQQGKCFAGFAA